MEVIFLCHSISEKIYENFEFVFDNISQLLNLIMHKQIGAITHLQQAKQHGYIFFILDEDFSELNTKIGI